MISRNKILVMFNGDYKSVCHVCLAVKEARRENVHLILIDNLQPAYTRQLRVTEAIADHYGVSYTAIKQQILPGAFSLTAEICIALSFAVKRQFNTIYFPCVDQRTSQYTYERTPVYISQLNQLVKASRLEYDNYNVPHVETPTIFFSPRQVCELGLKYHVPLKASWNCITDPDVPCHKCIGCEEWRLARRRPVKPH